MEKESNTDESDFSENEISDLNYLKPLEFEPKINIIPKQHFFQWILRISFQENLFYKTPPLAASIKACNFTKIRFPTGVFLWTF